MNLSPDRLMAGILEPVFAIRTERDLGIGDTDGVRQMIDWCHRHHLGIFQMLPINETSDDNSPYNAISSLAIDPATVAISPKLIHDLSAKEFSAKTKPSLLKRLRTGPVNYPEVKKLKRSLLETAFKNFLKRHFNKETARALLFRKFLLENFDWLSDYALFRVLMEENGNSPVWESWPHEHQGPRRTRAWLMSLPEKSRDALLRKQLFFMYVQWIAFSQWLELKKYGDAKKVYLMGDIPFGVSRHSADVWANRAVFDLDWSGGAPPEKVFKVDPFTEKWGQNWGVPIYHWDILRKQNFSWWRTRVGNLQKVFHLYRIDHVLGFFRIYSFPWTPDRNQEFLPLDESQAAQKTGGRLPGFKAFADDTHEHKEFNRQQGEEILRVVQEASGDTKVIAEDLGCVPDYVPHSLQKLHIPGFRIPFLFREHDGSFSDPKKYPRLTVAQPATHDHPPIAAAWEDAWKQIETDDATTGKRELRAMMDFAGLNNEEPEREFKNRFHEAFLRAVMNSHSWFAITMITDVFGQPARFNVPGSAAATNWSYRLAETVSQLDKDPQLSAKAKTYSRLVKESLRAE